MPEVGVKPLIGAALEVDGDELLLIARSLRGYSNLCRLVSIAHLDQPKGEARAGCDRRPAPGRPLLPQRHG